MPYTNVLQSMKPHDFCCGDTAQLQKEYYLNQAGGALPHFEGHISQRGHGIGTTISGAAKSVMPLIRPILNRVVKAVKRKALAASMGVVTDVISGKKLKTAMVDRAKEGFGVSKTTTTKPTKPRTNRKKPIRASARGRGGRGRGREKYIDTILY